MNYMNERMTNNCPTYQKPTIFGVKKSEQTPMAANRFMGSNMCCFCVGVGTSRT